MKILNIPVQVSDYAWKLYKAGVVDFAKGGPVFKDSHRFVELYKPLSMLDKTLSLVPIAPGKISVGDVVNGAINVANIAFSYANTKKLNRVISMLTTLQGLTWATTAIGVANLALNTVGFGVVNVKLDALSRQLSSSVIELKKEMRAIQLEDRTTRILTLIDNLKTISQNLSIKALEESNTLQIEPFLNNAKQQIMWLVKQFEESAPEVGGTLFTLLFDLTSMYSSVVKEYSTQYFYLEDRFPGNFAGWMEVFGYADSKPLQSGLKRTIWLANPVDTTEKLESAYDFTLNTVRLQQQELEETRQIVPELPREVYLDFDNYVKQKIEAGEVEVVEKAQEEDPRERVLLRKNGFAAA